MTHILLLIFYDNGLDGPEPQERQIITCWDLMIDNSWRILIFEFRTDDE